MNIGKNITAFRKDAGMTQEDLAGQIGVSAQAVSKWETGVSMPDILLLPVIADVFGITVDEIYTGKREPKEENKPHIGFDVAPEAVYQAMIDTMDRAWFGDVYTKEELLEEYKKNDLCASFIASEKGGAVYTNNEMGIVLRNFGTQKFFEILESEKAIQGLAVLMDAKVRRVLSCLVELDRRKFTANGISRKTGLTPEEAAETLDKMVASGMLSGDKAIVEDTDEIEVYTNIFGYDNSKLMNICLLLMLAEKMQSTNFYFHGYCGAYLPVDKD